MAANDKNINLRIKGVDDGASKTLDNLLDKAKKARAEAAKPILPSGIAGFAKSLQRQDRLEGETALGGILRGGAGGIAGAAFSALGVGVGAMVTDAIGQGLNSMVQKAAEMRKEIRAGKMTGMDAASEVIGQVPLIGGFWSAGRGLHNMLSDDAQAQEREKELTTLDEKLKKARNDFFTMLSRDRAQMQEAVFRSEQGAQIAALGLTKGNAFGKIFAMQSIGNAGMAHDYNAAIAAKRREYREKYPEQDKLAKEIDDQRKLVASTPKTITAVGADLSGNTFRSEYTNKAYTTAKAQLDKLLAEHAAINKTISDGMAGFTADLDKDFENRATTAGINMKIALEKLAQDNVIRMRQSSSDLLDIQTEEQAQRLTAAKQFYEAEEALGKRALDKKIEAINEAARVDIEAGVDWEERLKQRDQAVESLRRQTATKLSEDRKARTDALAKMELGASLGNMGSMAELLRRSGRGQEGDALAIQANYRGRMSELIERFKDPRLSAQGRETILAELGMQKALMGDDLASGLVRGGSRYANTMAPATASWFSTGESDSMMTRHRTEDNREVKDLLKEAREHTELMRKLVAQMEKGFFNFDILSGTSRFR